VPCSSPPRKGGKYSTFGSSLGCAVPIVAGTLAQTKPDHGQNNIFKSRSVTFNCGGSFGAARLRSDPFAAYFVLLSWKHTGQLSRFLEAISFNEMLPVLDYCLIASLVA
jgi:hypothetical protein